MSTPAPLSRTLTAVLRRQADVAAGGVRLQVGQVTALVAGGRHVDVSVGGAVVRVPRLASYTPTVGDCVYLLASESVLLAIGTVD